MQSRLVSICVCLLAAHFGISLIVSGIPVIDVAGSSQNQTTILDDDDNNSTSNGTHKDLYVIKAVVYEIGILTEVNDDDNSTDDYSHERVDLTFFDAHSNGTHLDLGNIPLPVQTNVTGQVLTGIAPVHIGAIQDATDIFNTLPLTGTIVNISHSDTSFITLSHKPHVGENGTILDAADLAKIPGLDANAIQIDNTRSWDDDEDNEGEQESNPSVVDSTVTQKHVENTL